MTIEQKAKAYDEALKRAKAAIDIAADKDLVKGVATTIFPELRESEDERIRQFLVNHVSEWIGCIEHDLKISSKDVESEEELTMFKAGLAWLEKQKEISMPNSTELIEMWDNEKKMLEGKDFRGDEWRLAYNAYMDGFARGTCVKFKKQKEQDRMRYCIEYINPQYPLLDNGELNIRHLRITDEHGAEMALTLMLSFGAKIYALYRGNVKEGKLGEWTAPMIVDADDWYSTDWLHDILDCGCTL